MSNEINSMIDDLLVKYLLGECVPEEKAKVETWLGEKEENSIYFNQFKRIWDESKSLSTMHEFDEEVSWQKLKARMKPHRYNVRMLRTVILSIAATLLVFFGIIRFFQTPEQKGLPSNNPTIAKQIIFSEQMTRIDTLSDQSIVTLNRKSKLICPEKFVGKERRVALEGEAFFAISPNKEKPFIIEAKNHVEIKVLGTSFNVKSFDQYTEVVVETGLVEIRKFNKVILLHPNEKARINDSDSSIKIEANKDKLYKYYRSRQFECDNTPLWKVIEVLNEAYDDTIIIDNKELRKLTLTTSFDNESLESVLDVISETFDIQIQKKGHQYILK
ncbi:MAG: FecR domain-containing protein [Chitinophagaceae bacterium]|nr:FecR domain-containing protein [Chitinophagaceae bacterium]